VIYFLMSEDFQGQTPWELEATAPAIWVERWKVLRHERLAKWKREHPDE